MLFSHRFGSVETLSRAQYWLTHHGFEVVKTDEPSHDVSRLTLNVDFSKASAALALIDSIESSDPEGWPANSTPSRSLHMHSAHSRQSDPRHDSGEGRDADPLARSRGLEPGRPGQLEGPRIHVQSLGMSLEAVERQRRRA